MAKGKVPSNVPLIRYFPQGMGQEVFAQLRGDARVEVRLVRPDQREIDYRGNVCAWITYKGREFAVGRPDADSFLGALGRELGITFRQYRAQEANV